MSKVTLRSIAEASGLSPSGVSKALSAHPDMSQETIQRVNNLARKLNYQPSCFGTALKTGRTGILGFVGYEPQGISQRTYMPRLFDAVMNECHKRNLDLVLRPLNKVGEAFLPIGLIEPLTRQGGRLCQRRSILLN